LTRADPRWDEFTDPEWTRLATKWSREISGRGRHTPLPKLPIPPDSDSTTPAIDLVSALFLTGSSEAQWKFIHAASWFGNEESIAHLATGPVVGFLESYGDDYIDRIELIASTDWLFANMLKGCDKPRMSDAVWTRICAARDSG